MLEHAERKGEKADMAWPAKGHAGQNRGVSPHRCISPRKGEVKAQLAEKLAENPRKWSRRGISPHSFAAPLLRLGNLLFRHRKKPEKAEVPHLNYSFTQTCCDRREKPGSQARPDTAASKTPLRCRQHEPSVALHPPSSLPTAPGGLRTASGDGSPRRRLLAMTPQHIRHWEPSAAIHASCLSSWEGPERQGPPRGP